MPRPGCSPPSSTHQARAPWASPPGSSTSCRLAKAVGLSRATFARRFATLAGEPPLAYLTRWRMITAANLLRQGTEPLSVIADRVGYESEFAFARTFRRAHGQPPGRYRAQAQQSRRSAIATPDAGSALPTTVADSAVAKAG